ncbi:MAG: YraN family protein [Pseudomonadota bacterium]
MRAAGHFFEKAAENWLSERGLTTVARSFSCRQGEIDLIMRENDELVFVEVRYRRSRRYGGPEESVDQRKQKKIIRTAESYLARNTNRRALACRFDVMAITGEGEDLMFNWIQNAFSA